MTSFPTATLGFGGYILSVPTVAALRATPVAIARRRGDFIFVGGTLEVGDGAGGVYAWIPASLDDDDGQQTIKPFDQPDASPGRWRWSIKAESAYFTQVEELTSTVYDPVYGNLSLHGLYLNEVTVRAQGDAITVQQIEELQASVTGQFTATNANITNEQTARASADTALAQKITDLTATVSTNAGTASAAVHDEQTARATADTAIAQTVTNLTATVNTNLTNTNAAISNEQTARANGDSAVAQTVTNLTATVNSNLTNTNAAIGNEATARANADGALASRTSTLEAQMNNGSGSNLSAQISNEATARANADSALSQQISQVSAQTDPGLGARVTTVENAVSTLNGKTAAYFQVTSVAGNNRAELNIYADANSGAGVDITGNVSISGNLVVDGSLITSKIAQSAITGYYQAYTSQTFYGNGAQQSTAIISYTVHMDYPGDILLWATAGQSYTSTSGSHPWHLDIYVDGGDYGGCGGATATTDSASCSGRVSVGAGDHTVSLMWFGANVMSIPSGAGSLIAMRAYK